MVCALLDERNSARGLIPRNREQIFLKHPQKTGVRRQSPENKKSLSKEAHHLLFVPLFGDSAVLSAPQFKFPLNVLFLGELAG
jgi:hypothetical protein